jgi:hypothetical protein
LLVSEETPATEPLVNQTEYAKRRGVSKMTISRAVDRGRLVNSVVRDPGGKFLGILPTLADQEWAANSDYTDAPQRAPGADSDPEMGSESDATMGAVSVKEKYWKAKLAELKFKEAAAELIPARDVERKLVDVFTSCKTRLLGIPSRAKQALPHLTVADIGALDVLIREALEELADSGEDSA